MFSPTSQDTSISNICTRFILRALDPNYTDQYTGRRPSFEALTKAAGAAALFTLVGTKKSLNSLVNKTISDVKGVINKAIDKAEKVIKKLDEGGSSDPVP
jgi:hypothetical protein